MTHLVSNQPWGVIDFDTQTGQVVVREDWFYHWALWPGTRAQWTYAEKRATHNRIDRSIWAVWSHRVPISVRPKAGNRPPPFGAQARVSFDVRWALRRGHWNVTVWKMPPGTDPTGLHRSFVNEARHVIELNTADLAPRGAGNDAGASTNNFVTPPHEYGHTMSNPDEYNLGSPFLRDSASLINIGRQVRGRHLHLVVDALGRLAPQWTFST
ncbi:hypothetical protein [Allosphingosinicella deserti]|uniref:Uncharacterized protein n=1 Tax=Allosphingosinicella deserti TaxID=2116704 RepID=A0A2P7QR96_9SPHN|nr:hypothetical protein [Sphingomonas deserti]PSJ40464.1 hypothetical protein C7I55_09000 [Sphingomonas deserti]